MPEAQFKLSRCTPRPLQGTTRGKPVRVGSGPASGSVPPTTQAENPYRVPECPRRVPLPRQPWLKAGSSVALPTRPLPFPSCPSLWPWADRTQVSQAISRPHLLSPAAQLGVLAAADPAGPVCCFPSLCPQGQPLHWLTLLPRGPLWRAESLACREGRDTVWTGARGRPSWPPGAKRH